MTSPERQDLENLRLRDYQPYSRLRTARRCAPRAATAAIDAHTHIGRWLTGGRWATPDVAALIDLMDTCNIAAMVNFDGRWGGELEANLERYDQAYPERFATFCHVDWAALEQPRPAERLAADLKRSVAAGARGLKVWKDLGLHVRDGAGELVLPDDWRLGALWETAADLEIPVAIHTADPVAFFEPLDRHNERLEELLAHPDWSFADRGFPHFERLIESLEALVAAHPRTVFIGVHAGCYAENLAWVARMLQTYPNFHIDIGARIAELGRQPRATQALVLQYPDRVLFGTDEIPPNQATYEIYFRFLETADECFPYSPHDPPPWGRWDASAIHLPSDVLQQVYGENCARLIPGLTSTALYP